MAQHLERIDTDVHSVVILLLLSYVLSSAPRYVRELKDAAPAPVKTEATWRQLIRAGKYYTIEPYRRVWKQLRQSDVLAADFGNQTTSRY